VRQVEWIVMSGIAALVAAVALTASGLSVIAGVARWGRFPPPGHPAAQLAYAAAHPPFLPFVHGLAALAVLLLVAVAGGLYLILSVRRPRASRRLAALGVAGALVVAVTTAVQAAQWAVLAYSTARAAPSRSAIAAVQHLSTGPLAAVQSLGYLALAVWIVATGVLLWPLGRDVRALAVISILTGLATPFAQPALALWILVTGIWLLSPGPRLALLRAPAATTRTRLAH
jgi:hypothetical protein